MKSNLNMTLLLCLLAIFVLGDHAMGQRRNATKFDIVALKATTKISNQSGTKLVADFYATSKDENAALSPPSIIATYAALAHVAKGKTKEDLHKLLSFDGTEILAFLGLNNYLQENMPTNFRGESSGKYNSLGYFLVKTGRVDSNSVSPNEILTKFGTTYREIGFSESEANRINKEIADFLTKGMDERMFEEFECSVVKAGPDKVMNVLTAVFFQEGWTPAMSMQFEWRNDEPVMRPFSFDTGQKEIQYLSGIVSSHEIVTVNDQSFRGNQKGYRFPLNKCDLTIVKCDNGTALKELASVIAREGLRIQAGRRVNQRASFFIPSVDIATEFDFSEYARAKGCDSPFTEGTAEYVLGQDVYCSNAKVQSCFEVNEDGFTLRQITFAEAMAIPIGRNQRMNNIEIKIDTPYLILLTDRQLGTVLGMAFIANPVSEMLDDGF